MATKVTFDGVHPKYDGTYDLDFGAGFTNREWHEIKKISGVRVGEFDDALEAGDNDLVVAIAAIVLRRNNKPVDVDVLWDCNAGTIMMEDDAEVEDDADPPQMKPDTGQTSPTESSGKTSESTSENQVNGQSPTGSPHSVTPATSELLTSAT